MTASVRIHPANSLSLFLFPFLSHAATLVRVVIRSVSARKILNVDVSVITHRLDLFHHSPSSDKTRSSRRRQGEIYDNFSLISDGRVYRPGVQQ